MYYIDDTQVINSFAVIFEKLYRFDDNGYMFIGWFYDEFAERWYYFSQDGSEKDGWIYDESNWYYLNAGNYLIGWSEIESEDEVAYWFCFDENGVLYTDCETPDGYLVNEDGVYIGDKEVIGYMDKGFGWSREPNAEPGQLSGLTISGQPTEFYMLCIAGETSGLSNLEAVKNGDRGCAYGACQLDYRYDLVDYMNFAYKKHPKLWSAFESYLDLEIGCLTLKGNNNIGKAFVDATSVDFETAISDQLEFMTMTYWDDCKNKLNASGFDLDNRHVAVSAALFSVNVICVSQPNIFINHLSSDMTDEEMIREIYRLRNTVFAQQRTGKAVKGTTKRYRIAEPQLALDLLYGHVTIDSDINYGGGVEWHGNPFANNVSTLTQSNRVLYLEETYEDISLATDSDAETKIENVIE